MVIDTSALLAILGDEPERGAFNQAIEAADTRSRWRRREAAGCRGKLVTADLMHAQHEAAKAVVAKGDTCGVDGQPGGAAQRRSAVHWTSRPWGRNRVPSGGSQGHERPAARTVAGPRDRRNRRGESGASTCRPPPRHRRGHPPSLPRAGAPCRPRTVSTS